MRVVVSVCCGLHVKVGAVGARPSCFVVSGTATRGRYPPAPRDGRRMAEGGGGQTLQFDDARLQLGGGGQTLQFDVARLLMGGGAAGRCNSMTQDCRWGGGGQTPQFDDARLLMGGAARRPNSMNQHC